VLTRVSLPERAEAVQLI